MEKRKMTEEEKKAQKKECENAWKKGMSNIETKIFFNEWLNKAIDKDNEDLFEWCLKKIGTEWHVSRTVPEEQLDDFIKYMWNNKEKIKEGAYHYWEADEYKSLKINKENRYFFAVSRPCSFESKICFLINPQKYFLIYDGNNRNALKAKGYKDKDVTIENFNETAKEYMKKQNPKTEEDYFKEDYKLWSSQDKSK